MKTIYYKRILFRLAVLCCVVVLATGCQKEPLSVSDPLKYRVDAVKSNYDGVPDTRTVKTGWSEGDKLYIWYEDRTEPFSATYTGSGWNVVPPAEELVGRGKLYAIYGENVTQTANGFSFGQGDICYTTTGTYAATGHEIVLNLPMTQRPQGRVVFTGVSAGEMFSLQHMRSIEEVRYTPGKFDFQWKTSDLSSTGEADNTVAFYCLPISDAGSNTTLYIEQNGTQYKRTFDNKKLTANKSITVASQNDTEAWDEYDGTKIVYTTTDGKILNISFPNYQEFGQGVKVISHIQTGDNEFTIECDGPITIIPSIFMGKSTLKSIVLPESLLMIEDYAFYNCNNLSGPLTIPEGVIKIGFNAFYSCSSLTGPLIIPESVTTIKSSAFQGCRGLTGPLTIPEGVTTIEDYAFYLCSGLSGPLTIPEGVTKIGDYAFYECSKLTGPLTIPESVTTIGDYAFYECKKLTGSLTIPESVTTIGESAFFECSGLTGSLTIPGNITTIEGLVFVGCSFTEDLVIHERVTKIGNGAFCWCAFKNVYCKAIVPPDLQNTHPWYSTFSNSPEKTLYVPVGSKDAYLNAEGWKDFKFKEIVEMQF